MGAGAIVFEYDMDVLIGYIIQLFQNFWPIIALWLGIILAGFLIGTLAKAFIVWIKER